MLNHQVNERQKMFHHQRVSLNISCSLNELQNFNSFTLFWLIPGYSTPEICWQTIWGSSSIMSNMLQCSVSPLPWIQISTSNIHYSQYPQQDRIIRNKDKCCTHQVSAFIKHRVWYMLFIAQHFIVAMLRSRSKKSSLA